MGSLWCLRRVSHIDSHFLHIITLFDIINKQHTWVGKQTKKSYKDFVGQIDMMTDEQVRWTSYSQASIDSRAPQGLSSLCF
jgi:hypothetical protein